MVPPKERRPRWRDTHTGIVILVMFLICAPTLQRLLSYLSGVVMYVLIPIAIVFKILDIYLLNTRPLNRIVARMLEIDNIDSHSVSQSFSLRYRQLRPPLRYKSTFLAHDGAFREVERREHRSGTRSKKPDIKIEPPPRFPVLPTEVMIEPNSATAPQPVEMMSWNRNSFSNPAIQEKLRQQSVLYHQIHDLLAERTRNRSAVEGNNLKLAGNLNQTRAPLSPIPEPTYKVEGVDHAKIQALKNKYPNKQALHKHLDSFSAIMSRFMALSAPDVSILDLKDPVFDEKKQTTGRETDKALRSPRSSPRMDRPIIVSDSPTLPPLPRPSWHLADIPEEKLVDGV
ncbi:hypothetical protein TWF569_003303 [Orbilia oligospora]|uniref:Uncharacterized protein n=1 Tax=Orbilia oligospora TaxID=2813651 RepID=A0A7C8NH13_ORBOL|nr:hypothetical protein TWF102_003418 [Orbilia oligospora]KAF3104709.1 hypothetical protein TWF706_004491 [Orbilia oligospora]KAF3115405.1 hypothetical protein TWF103_010831 [Orbilia oligospora]KAF3120363.1 hypothetical protein TWF569_003303 [Orbilia oligospora]